MPRNRNDLSRFSKENGQQLGILSELDLTILWYSRTLADIDFRYESELLRLDQSSVEEDRKNDMKRAMLLRHRERREPYVSMLESLRKQQPRQSFAA